ncbi:MAG: hypothetical protein ABW277_05425 [Longimicrobiaceae bacterium]
MMHSPPGGAFRLPGYDLQEPSEADAVAALERVFGPERAADRWSRACRDAGVLAGHLATGAQLGRAVAALAEQGGTTAVVARSMEIRMRTFARLSAGAAAVAAGRQP